MSPRKRRGIILSIQSAPQTNGQFGDNNLLGVATNWKTWVAFWFWDFVRAAPMKCGPGHATTTGRFPNPFVATNFGIQCRTLHTLGHSLSRVTRTLSSPGPYLGAHGPTPSWAWVTPVHFVHIQPLTWVLSHLVFHLFLNSQKGTLFYFFNKRFSLWFQLRF